MEELARTAHELDSVDAVPDSLQGAMAAQIDALDPTTRRLLRYASVLGPSFRMDILVEVLTAEGITVDAASLVAASSFVDRDGADRLRFRNGLIRDAAYDGLPYRVRSRLHRGRRGGHRAGSTGDAAADALALHFSRAGDAGADLALRPPRRGSGPRRLRQPRCRRALRAGARRGPPAPGAARPASGSGS